MYDEAHEPASEDYYTAFNGFQHWLEAVLMYTEELGRARGYFSSRSPYMKTYNRALTVRQTAMRAAYTRHAKRDHAEEVKSEYWDDADKETFNV